MDLTEIFYQSYFLRVYLKILAYIAFDPYIVIFIKMMYMYFLLISSLEINFKISKVHN